MNNILYTLFQDNPELPGEVYRFCKTLPDYCQAVRKFRGLSEQVAQLLGGELYSEFEESLFSLLAQETRAYYLFGLGLRRELMRGMMR